MKRNKVSPEQMDVIINVQMLKGKIYQNYDQFSDFKNLSLLTIEQLRRLQDRLIPEYNKTFAK
jgi:hypothetical protein